MRSLLLLALCVTPGFAEIDLSNVKETGYVIVESDEIAHEHVSNVLFLDFCDGGCELRPGTDNAITDTSQIIESCENNSPVTITEYAGGTDVRQAIVDCVKDVYAPYDVDVVTSRPSGSHHRAIVAGFPEDTGCPNPGFLGIAPASGNCTPRDNAISFTFANAYGTTLSRAERICATVAQESAHSYGLLNHVGDCSDPMTYIGASCGRKYFRNKAMPCSESFSEPIETMQCRCTGSAQNSHILLNTAFGVGTLPPGPEVDITFPQNGASVSTGSSVQATWEDARGTARAELWVNGWKYDEDGGKLVIDNSSYSFDIPPHPDGNLAVTIKVFNDLEIVGEDTVNVVQGAPCTSEATCDPGQQCMDGGCWWDEPHLNVGESCEYIQDCISGICESDGTMRICTEQCFVGEPCSDPSFECLDTTGGATGICWPKSDDGGCCSTKGSMPVLPLLALIGFGLLVWLPRRRSI